VRTGFFVALLAMAPSLACQGDDPTAPVRSALRQPSGLALHPDGRWLFVANGNWDLEESHETLVAVDLESVHAALASSNDARCQADANGVRQCDPSAFIDAGATVLMGSGLGSIAIDLPRGPTGTPRLLVVQRSPAALRWLDVFVRAGGFSFDCGQDAQGVCDERHAITQSRSDPNIRLPRDPSRVIVDREGFRFAYVPHLLGGALSLVRLDGDSGPSLQAVVGEFYRVDPFDDGLDLAGGFSVAQRPCDPDDPPQASRDCTRPLLFTTHRYWPGVRQFTVAPGLQVVLGGPSTALDPINPDVVHSRPFMGDLAFEDDTGDQMLVVQTTPGGLARVDTSLDDDGVPRAVVRAVVPICGNPNLLALHEAPGQEPLALVTCFGDGALTVVALGSFTAIRTIELGEGANEIVIDDARRQAYVANARDDTISIVSLERDQARFLTEWARIGKRD
jgi:hypothetical protein